MNIPRNSREKADDPISRMAIIIKLRSILSVSYNQSLAIKIMALHATIPIDTRTKEAFTNTLASSSFCSEKLFPRNRRMPEGIPIVAATAKMPAKETIAEEVPIISVVPILDIIIQKTYPEIIITMVSI
jgi:hypothetical protein